MKVGIIGYRGFVGSAIFEFFIRKSGFLTYGIDRTNWEKFIDMKFDIIVDCDGNSSKFIASKDPVYDIEANVVNEFKVISHFSFNKLILLSTVDVYNDKSKPETTNEDITINPLTLSNYGFSKYVRELSVMRTRKDWAILRLGGMVGKGLKKGPVFDILNDSMIFLHPESRLQFINTEMVAKIVAMFCENDFKEEVFNIVGMGSISLNEIADLIGVKLRQVGEQKEIINVSSKKISKLMNIPSTIDTIKQFTENRDT